MPLFRPLSVFQIINMEHYNVLVELLDRQIEMVCPSDKVFKAKYAMHEALDNAIEHGEFPVQIEFRHAESGELSIKITDNGKGFSVYEKI